MRTRNTRKSVGEALTRLRKAKGRTCIDGGERAVSYGDVHPIVPIKHVLQLLAKREESGSRDLHGVASDVNKSVALLILSNGMGRLSASAGIAIECRSDATKFLTTSALIKPLYTKIECPDDLKIEVHYEGGVWAGHLEEYDHNIVVVKVLSDLDVYLPVDHVMGCSLPGKGIAIWGQLSGTLFAASLDLPHFESFAELPHLKESLCGGMVVLFDLYGNFAGLSLGSEFVPRHGICELLHALRKERVEGEDGKHYTHPDACRYVLNKFHVRDGYCLGYPMPPSGDMILINTFEEPFGDIYPNGVWSTFKGDYSTMDQNVVSLASFKGNTRLFACTGFFIDFDENYSTVMTSASLLRDPKRSKKIIEGLEIKVLLKDKRKMEGMVQHCSLRYNVALISIKNFCAPHPVKLDFMAKIVTPSIPMGYRPTLIAVGRCFESGTLMATSGEIVHGRDAIRCDVLFYSSCKVTKAGIGGPLVDLDGKFMGINFYNWHMGTPFILREDLCGILKYFKTEVTRYDRGFEKWNIVPDFVLTQRPDSWRVLEPCWCHPDYLKEDCLTPRERKIINSGFPYTYIEGEMAFLK